MKAKREKRDAKIKKVFGGEPTFDPKVPLTDSQQGDAYNWYHYNLDDAQIIEYLVDFMVGPGHAMYAKDADLIRNLNFKAPAGKDRKYKPGMEVLSYIGRLICRGYQVTARSKSLLYERLDELLNKIASEPKESIDRSKFRERIRSAEERDTDIVMEQIEISCDNYHTGKPPVDIYNLFLTNGFPRKVANNVIKAITPRITEVEGALAGKDPGLVEAYSSYSKKDMQKLIFFYKSMINSIQDSQRVKKETKKVESAKVQQKKTINLKKVKDPLLKLSYQKEFAPLRLVSIAPSNILTAKKLWVYNTKYKWIGVYVAEEGKYLSVTGTSMVNYNEKKSIFKRLRKPEQQIAELTAMAEMKMEKTFSAIKTTETPIRSRISEDIILLKSFK